MSTVTIVEDVGMVLMAIVMIYSALTERLRKRATIMTDHAQNLPCRA